MQIPDRSSSSLAVLYVDDEPSSRKIFSAVHGEEFNVVTADGVAQALELLSGGRHEFAVLVTDYRMPDADGMTLLRAVQRDHRHLIRLLVTAYAAKDVAIAAVNQGKVLRILEKPLDDDVARDALREAMALYQAQALERSVNEGRAAALRETLGFLAHELNTPLATVSGSVASVIARIRSAEPVPGDAELPRRPTSAQLKPADLLAALERAERRAVYCQSIVATFVQSARDAYPGVEPGSVAASALARAVLDEYPFEADERSWVSSSVVEDFQLPGRRDLLYLVLCTITKNALIALRETAASRNPALRIDVGRDGASPARGWIRFTDNGPGIEPEVLARLTHEPLTTRAATGGNGMGLLFCRRVMQSAEGEIVLSSEAGSGTCVSLYFPMRSAIPVGR